MLAAERRSRIAECLKAEGRVLVSQLSSQFAVSEETIRRDLERLEQDGVASRTYGGAILRSEERTAPPFAIRKNTNPEGKLAIARRLAAMLQDGDTVMVDESSTAAYAVRAMHPLKNITLITNSLEILREMNEQKSWHILSTGGTLKPELLALAGPHALRAIASFHVDWTILSCRGINTRLGMADSDEDIVQVKQAMMAAADRTILLADHRKFDRNGFVALGALSLVDRLITDLRPPQPWIDRLEKLGVELVWDERDGALAPSTT